MTDQVTDQVCDQVARLLPVLAGKNLSALECMGRLEMSHRPTFLKNYLNPAIADGYVELTIPDKPQSRMQKYRLTKVGCGVVKLSRRAGDEE